LRSYLVLDLDLSLSELPDLAGAADGAAEAGAEGATVAERLGAGVGLLAGEETLGAEDTVRAGDGDALGELSGEGVLAVSLSDPDVTGRDDDTDGADARDAAELESDPDGALEPGVE